MWAIPNSAIVLVLRNDIQIEQGIYLCVLHHSIDYIFFANQKVRIRTLAAKPGSQCVACSWPSWPIWQWLECSKFLHTCSRQGAFDLYKQFAKAHIISFFITPKSNHCFSSDLSPIIVYLCHSITDSLMVETWFM